MTSDPLKKLSGSGRFRKVAKIALGWGQSSSTWRHLWSASIYSKTSCLPVAVHTAWQKIYKQKLLCC